MGVWWWIMEITIKRISNGYLIKAITRGYDYEEYQKTKEQLLNAIDLLLVDDSINA